MWLVVGLGNPGKKYANNRHNVGFMVVDELARRHALSDFKEKFGGLWTDGRVSLNGGSSAKAHLLKPMEFMNLSGFSVSRAAQYHSIEAENIVVVHDEADLPFGKLKLKSGGGHGGHNGLRSIGQQLGSRDHPRVRLGVDKPRREDGQTPGDGRVANYLLSDFPAANAAELDAMIRRGCDAVEAIIGGGITSAMNDFNGAPESQS